jgi:hypothetical protein
VDDPADKPSGDRIFMVEITVRRAGEEERNTEPNGPAPGLVPKKEKRKSKSKNGL